MAIHRRLNYATFSERQYMLLSDASLPGEEGHKSAFILCSIWTPSNARFLTIWQMFRTSTNGPIDPSKTDAVDMSGMRRLRRFIAIKLGS